MAGKRALILAGGGVKVAFQAGVLQVWLDEAGLAFDHADGASGGCLNLAMWCQGMSGAQIADAWRRTKPVEGVSLNILQFPRMLWARSLFTLEAYRRSVFPEWGLNWAQIQASPREATFNVFNFTRQELEVLSPTSIDEDGLCACVSLPIWFEPVVLNGDTYIDAVYATDGNIEEAIRRGADEVWVIWTVSLAGRWEDGFVANYFQIIEASANSNYKRACRRIEENNAAIAQGRTGEFGRHIELKVLQAEVPIHYLVNFSQDRLVECVNLGVQQARQWCHANGIPLGAGPVAPTDVHTVQTSLSFAEVMRGYATFGEADYEQGAARGKRDGAALSIDITINVDGVNHFITDPQHEASVFGYVDCPQLGGRREIISGRFNLLVDDGALQRKVMTYRLWFADSNNRPLTLLGMKHVEDDPGADAWTDTTTLYTRILEGHRTAAEEGGDGVLAAGILKLHFADFMKELTTFRVNAPTAADRIAALTRFGKLFFGKLWDVYAVQILSNGPI